MKWLLSSPLLSSLNGCASASLSLVSSAHRKGAWDWKKLGPGINNRHYRDEGFELAHLVVTHRRGSKCGVGPSGLAKGLSHMSQQGAQLYTFLCCRNSDNVVGIDCGWPKCDNKPMLHAIFVHAQLETMEPFIVGWCNQNIDSDRRKQRAINSDFHVLYRSGACLLKLLIACFFMVTLFALCLRRDCAWW